MSGNETRIQGERAESVVKFMADRYREAGIATLWQQGTIAIPTRSGWKPINSLPDFGGVLHGSGRAIAFDVKSTTKPRYTHPKSRSHQLQHLWKVHAAGGVAGLLIQWLDNHPDRQIESWYWAWPQPSWQDGQSLAVVMSLESSKRIGVWRISDWGEVYESMPDFLNLESTVFYHLNRYYTGGNNDQAR